MDLHLPITTINGEPIEPLVLALPPLVRAVAAHVDALVHDEPTRKIVVAPCVRRALLPIWHERFPLGPDWRVEDLSPFEACCLMLDLLEALVGQVEAALLLNEVRRAA